MLSRWSAIDDGSEESVDLPGREGGVDGAEVGENDDALQPDGNRFEPPHDILAAEEFAMPAGGERYDKGSRGPEPRTLVPLLVIAALLALLAVRRRR